MFWHLVLLKYKQWRLQHLLMLLALFAYSIIGAVCFVAFEQQNESVQLTRLRTEMLLRSTNAKKEFINKFKKQFQIPPEKTISFTRNMRTALTKYDQQMGLLVNEEAPVKWTIWGGLYYAGTIFTTIGYGDIATETVGGRIFTMFYAIIGIPLVVIVLTDWGSLLFDFMKMLWIRSAKGFSTGLKSFLHIKKNDHDANTDKLPLVSNNDDCGGEAIPFKLAIALLIFWILLCASVFCLFEEWTLFESIYFFVVSLTTIGFGDLTPRHTVAVGNFLLILGGLSVVSMSINVIQMQIENLFARMVQSIESDFKHQILEGEATFTDKGVASGQPQVLNGDLKATESAQLDKRLTIEPPEPKHVNYVEEYEKNVSITEKLLLKLMSNHQKQMLNEKKEERLRLRNRATQTTVLYVSSLVQTDEIKKITELESLSPVDRESETNLPNKFYIYNTGD